MYLKKKKKIRKARKKASLGRRGAHWSLAVKGSLSEELVGVIRAIQ